MYCKKVKRVNLTLNESEYEYLKEEAIKEGDLNLSGFAKRKMFKGIGGRSCQTA
ncbi:hypothetical protein MJH12_16945 [bacterium]|nr:hypothetical protein [bacterium]